MTAQPRDLAAEVERIRPLLSDASPQDVETLLAHIAALTRELEHLKCINTDQHDYADEELTRLRAENERLAKRLAMFEESTSAYEQQLGIEPESATKTIGSEIERLRAEVERKELANEHLREGMANLAAKVVGLESQLTEARSRAEFLDQLWTEARKEADSAADRIEQMEDERDEARKTCAEWLQQNAPGGWIDGLRQRVGRLEGALPLMREALEIFDSHADWDDDHPAKIACAEALNAADQVMPLAAADGQQKEVSIDERLGCFGAVRSMVRRDLDRELVGRHLAPPSYVLSQPHLSGHRVILGFETLEAAQAAHELVAMRWPANEQPSATGDGVEGE